MQEAHNVTDFVFGLKDVIMLIGGVGSLVGTYFALKMKQNIMQDHMTTLKEDIVSASRGRHATKKECFEKIGENHDIVMNRIDKTQFDFKDFTKETNAEFKSINETLNKIVGLLENK